MSETISERELSIEEYGKRSFLRPVQRQELERSISGIEERLAQPILLEMAGGDASALQKQLRKEQAMLDGGTPPKLDNAGQRRVYAKMHKCEDIILNGLPTFTMMDRGRPQDVDHHVSHENASHRDNDGKYTTKRAIQAWKNYRLTLDPNSIEPNFLSIASLRTDTMRGNPGLFRKNYDHVRFREFIEESLTNELDDETYFLFCGLKALDWAEATIRLKFDWTQKMYDGAMERWRTDMGQGHLLAPDMGDDARHSTAEPDAVQDKLAHGSGGSAVELIESVTRAEHTADEPESPKAAIWRGDGPRPHPRVQIAKGWPRNELRDLGITNGEFCKEWGMSGPQLQKYSRTGEWSTHNLKTARAALARLKVKYDVESAEPVEPAISTEPALVYDSAEPVAI